jgi:hypothetical protein
METITVHPAFTVQDRFEQIVLLRILRAQREQMCIRKLAIENLSRIANRNLSTPTKYTRRGELINVQAELNSLDKFIANLCECVGRV